MDEVLKYLPIFQPVIAAVLGVIANIMRSLRRDVESIKCDVAELRTEAAETRLWRQMHSAADETRHEEIDRRLDVIERRTEARARNGSRN